MAVAAQAARPARRHTHLLRPRIYRGKYQIRQDHRAGQQSVAGARERSARAARRRQGNGPDHARRGEKGKLLPARRRAGGRSIGRHERTAGSQGVRGDP